MSQWVKTILFLLLSAFLSHLLPFNEFFRNLDTMIHEFGHALMTLVLSGKVMYIELFANHSGVTYSQITKPWSLVPIAMAGYISASLFALFLFWARAHDRERLGLQLITLVALSALILFVRGEFGVMWLIGFIVLNVIMLAFMPGWLRDFYYLLVAFITLEESVFGPFSLVLYALQNPSMAGDATNLSRATGFPAIGWGILFTVIALWCAVRALRLFLRGRRTTPVHTAAWQAKYED